MNITAILKESPEDQLIRESLVLTNSKIKEYGNIMCSVSGGSDSDILFDLCRRLDDKGKVTYTFFDTGLEYNATREHLQQLENSYGVEIKRVKALKSIPVCCRQYGIPFLSKQVSEWMERLQKHEFKWEDGTLEQLLEKYPHCRAALRWWCNDFQNGNSRQPSRFNIAYHRFLKEFIMENPPDFRISNKCCTYAKKKVASNFLKEGNFSLNMYGVRKAEGGVRGTAYKTCFNENNESSDEYRPIFWYINETKKIYEDFYEINHSKCYTEYGLKRTGCAGCPYGQNVFDELEIMKTFEPGLFKATNHIFGKSYEYTKKYREYVSNNIKGNSEIFENSANRL